MNPIKESAIFLLQTIDVGGVKINIFFDNGCKGLVIKKSAADKLAEIGRAKQIFSGPLDITGVGDKKSVSEDGVYSICLPLHDGRNATFSGICLPKITSEFPKYELKVVEKYLRNQCKRVSKNDLGNALPKLPRDTDILMGSQYLMYFPKIVFECKSGLGIYRSVFESPCGARGVVAGPHREFSRIEENFKGYIHVAFRVITRMFRACVISGE